MENELRIKFFLTLAILTTGTLSSFALDFQKISIKEALNIALENSMYLKGEKINTQIAKNTIKQANRLQNPSIDYYHNFGKAGAGNPNTIGATNTIELLKRKNRKNLARANYEIALQNSDYAAFILKTDVEEAYIKLVAAKTILNSLEQEKKSLEEIEKITRAKLTNKKSGETDYFQAKIALNKIITQINLAQAEVLSARFDFNSAMDTDPIYDTKIELFDDDTLFSDLKIPTLKENIPDYEKILEIAKNNRFDLKIAQKRIISAKENLKVVGANRVPDLEVGAGYGFQPASMSESGKYLNGAYLGASLVNLPILYNYSPEIKNAKLEVQKAELDYDAIKNNALANLNSAYQRFVHARMNLEYYSDAIVLNSKEMMKNSKKNYELNKTDLTSVIVLEQSYREIILGFALALSKYCNCWVDLLREVHTDEIIIESI